MKPKEHSPTPNTSPPPSPRYPDAISAALKDHGDHEASTAPKDKKAIAAQQVLSAPRAPAVLRAPKVSQDLKVAQDLKAPSASRAPKDLRDLGDLKDLEVAQDLPAATRRSKGSTAPRPVSASKQDKQAPPSPPA